MSQNITLEAAYVQATRAYLHAEKDVEAALQRAGFKVG